MNDSSRDLAGTMLQAAFIGALAAGCFWILRPFLLPMIWATAIVVSTWPLMTRLQAYLGGRRGLAVTVMTLLLLLVLLIPLAFTIAAIAQNADRIIGWAKSLGTVSIPPPPDWVVRLPLIGLTIAGQWQQVAELEAGGLSARLAPYASTIVAWFVAQVGNVGMMLVQFVLTVVVAAVLYTCGETAAAGVRQFARRLAGAPADGLLQLAAQAVRAVALGVVVTALIQAILGGIGLAICGVPFVVVLIALMLILGIAQLGPGFVLIPAIVWLYWKGDTTWGTVLLVWTLVVLGMDNFLRPMLIKRGADLPLLLIFTGVIGGLVAFGILGLFIGPVLLAVGYTLLAAWVTGHEAETTPADTGAKRSGERPR
jgi:predicted PurR-regulated permease PerM